MIEEYSPVPEHVRGVSYCPGAVINIFLPHILALLMWKNVYGDVVICWPKKIELQVDSLHYTTMMDKYKLLSKAYREKLLTIAGLIGKDDIIPLDIESLYHYTTNLKRKFKHGTWGNIDEENRTGGLYFSHWYTLDQISKTTAKALEKVVYNVLIKDNSESS